MFYDGELVAMTRNDGNHLEIVKTVEGNHARTNPSGSGLYNQREIDEIANVLNENNSKSVGIITPFRYQADLLTGNLLLKLLKQIQYINFRAGRKGSDFVVCSELSGSGSE